MGVRERIEALSMQSEDTILDWEGFRDEIHHEFGKAKTSEEREFLLEAHKILNDQLERNLDDPEYIKMFQEARLKDYRLLIAQECLVGTNVSPQILDAVTRREVAAGRMAPDDELVTLGKIGSTFNLPEPNSIDTFVKPKKYLRYAFFFLLALFMGIIWLIK
jgi:hypothetical protein